MIAAYCVYIAILGLNPHAELFASFCRRADLLRPSLILASVGLKDGLSTVCLRLEPVLAGTAIGCTYVTRTFCICGSKNNITFLSLKYTLNLRSNPFAHSSLSLKEFIARSS